MCIYTVPLYVEIERMLSRYIKEICLIKKNLNNQKQKSFFFFCLPYF